MLKKISFWIVVSCLFLLGTNAAIPDRTGLRSEPQFSRQKDDLGKMLDQLEALVNKVDTRKIITIEDDADINKLFDDYPEKMNALDEEASKDPQMSQQFIDLLTAHQRRVKALQSKLGSVESQAKTAKIVPDRSMLQGFSSSELQKYTSFLSSEGLSRIKQVYPEIFNKQPEPEPIPEWPEISAEPETNASGGPFIEGTAGSPASAAGCYSEYLSCRRDCNSFMIPWACKGGCLLLYIACKLS